MTLTDERIDRMRDHVLAGVDADAERRGRRTRRVLGAGAAACFVLVIGGVGLATLTGPLGTGSGSGVSSTAETEPDGGRSGAAERDAAEPEADGESGPDLTTQPSAERDVVVTGSVDVTVEDAREAAARLATWVEGRDGRVDARAEQADGARSSARLTLRVTASDVDAALAELDELGDVERVDLDREDVAAQRRDLDARIGSLEVSVQRLEAILAEAGSSADLLATERAIQERQGELESLQAQKDALADRVALSTLTVDLTQERQTEKPPTDEDRSGFLDGLQTGWDALTSTATDVVRVIGVLLPWLGLLAAGYVGWRVVRRTRGSGPGAPR
ncbi:DUF4349 domain-containing protein [Aeromicrobium sp. CF4.19]|uniref:DUF4349 domain-containing protein n=1 Tax=Aeromicrobium sp. CF4.19 TaxID=3373082 RepID=UPI003EE730F8